MKIPWRASFLFVVFLAVASCDKKTDGSVAGTTANSDTPPKLPPSQEILILIALHESVIQDAWDDIGERLIAGDAEVIFESSSGTIGFVRAEEPHDEPAKAYIVGGAVSGIIEISRTGDKVERVTMRPGEFGFPYLQTTVTLYDVDHYDPFEDSKADKKQNKSEMATPRKPSD